MILRSKDSIENDEQLMMTKTECMGEGPMKELVGFITMISKSNGENARFKFTQLLSIYKIEKNWCTWWDSEGPKYIT